MSISTIFVLLLVTGTALFDVTQSQANRDCPEDCPEGWYQLGAERRCYWFPPQQPEPASFWEWQRRCKAMEPTANIIVLNDIKEEASLAPVSLQYGSNWTSAGRNSFVWIGGYTNEGGWKFLDDCSDCTSRPLFHVSSVVGSEKNNTCLAVNIKTSGEWLTKPCSDAIGIAFCEMPMRQVCRNTPSGMALTPLNTSPASLASLFLSSIPYIDQILAWSISGDKSALQKMEYCLSGIDAYRGNCKIPISDSGVAKPTPLPANCRWQCPFDWWSWSDVDSGRCYLFPGNNPQVGSFWDMEDYCQKKDESAHVSIMSGIVDQAIATAMAGKGQWQKKRPEGFLWLGAYTTNLQWKLVNGGDVRSILQMAMANLSSRLDGTFRNGTCLTADLATAGKWSQAPCNKPGGLAICEMPKKVVCDRPAGDDESYFDFPPDWLTIERLKRLFPASPEIPFLTEASAARIRSNFNSTIIPGRTETREIFCAKKAAKLTPTDVNPKPEWDWLDADGKRAMATGTFSTAKCGPSAKSVIWVFEVDPQVYLDAWTRCYNDGWEVAMVEPGWTPFMVNKKVAEHYRENSSSKFGIRGNDKLEGFTKVGMIDPSKC